jgi:hypothetical protein
MIEENRLTNVIVGHQAIAPSAAISWAKVFYRALSLGVPLSKAFDSAQDAADPGLMLLARRDIRFIRQMMNTTRQPDAFPVSLP